MGYYTYFDLHTRENTPIPSREDYEAITAYLCNLFYTDVKDAVENLMRDYSENQTHFYAVCNEGEMKWYHHDEDMLELSKQFPQYEFVLEGTGEDRDDNWITHYKNGKFFERISEIVYDPAPSESWWD